MCISALIRRPGKAPLMAHNLGQFCKAMRTYPVAMHGQNLPDDTCLCAVDFGATIRANGLHATYDPTIEAWDLTLPWRN